MISTKFSVLENKHDKIKLKWWIVFTLDKIETSKIVIPLWNFSICIDCIRSWKIIIYCDLRRIFWKTEHPFVALIIVDNSR